MPQAALGRFRLNIMKNVLIQRVVQPDTAAQGSGGVPIPEDVYMWHLGTWASGGLGSAGFMVGLEDSGGLFQLK